MKRRDFLKLAAIGTVASMADARAFAKSGAKPFEIEEASISEMQTVMESGDKSSVSLVKSYLKRIEEIDRRGPALSSVLELNPDALEIAAALDKERKERGPRGPLHGIPILIKDNIA